MMLTKPNDFVAEVHDRMPMLLKPEQFERWLSGDMRVEDLKPVNNDYLYRWPVSKRVNSSKADSNDSTLIAKWAKRHPRLSSSTTVAALALHTALFNPESLILLLSRSQRQSSELFRKVVAFYQTVESHAVKIAGVAANQVITVIEGKGVPL